MQTLQPFYITGLPRTRSAWLANLFNWGKDVSCQHEPLARTKYWDDEAVARMFALPGTPFSGVSDSGLPIVGGHIVDTFPGPILVVRRDPNEVLTSLSNYMGKPEREIVSTIIMMTQRLVEFREEYPHMSVGYDELSDVDRLAEIWEFLVPGVDFPRWRAIEMQRFHVEVWPDKMLEGADPEMMEHLEEIMAPAMSES